MVYFYLTVYFLVNILIQEGVAQSQQNGSIWSNTTTVSLGDSYTISCQSKHASRYGLWVRKHTADIGYIADEKCIFLSGVNKTEYICSNEKRGDTYHVNLTILSESSPTSIKWSCVYKVGQNYKFDSLTINVSNDPSKTTQQKPNSIPEHKTPQGPAPSSRQPTRATQSPVPSPRQPTRATRSPAPLPSSSPSLSSSKDPQTTDRAPSSCAPSDQPPVSSDNIVDKLSKLTNDLTNNLIGVCVVLVLSITMNVIMVILFLSITRKLNQAKQDLSRPLALEPRGILGEESNYDNLDRTLVNEDDGHIYDTAQARDDVSEGSNPNSNDDDIPP